MERVFEKARLSKKDAISLIFSKSDVAERDMIGHRISVELRFPEVVSILIELFGGSSALARTLGMREARAVRRWVEGRPSRLIPEERMRFALRLATIIYDSEKPWICSAWFNSFNPYLRDQEPADLLRSWNPSNQDLTTRLLNVAKSFRTAAS